ncbi:hypothetical protein V6N13_024551 [Hibiscus sabdariffa]
MGIKFNVGQVIAKELSDICQTNRAILAFPYLISALCLQAAVPTQPKDLYTPRRTGWARKDYMKKMDLTDVIPIQMDMPSIVAADQPDAHQVHSPTPAEDAHQNPGATPQESPANSPDATPEVQASSATTPGSTSAANDQPPPAQTTDAPPFHLLQLRNKLQRMEARKRKTPAARVLTEDVSPTTTEAKAEEQTSPQAPKRQRRYHVITTESDTNFSKSPTF